MGKYDDIIDLPHHVSASHPHMPMIDRAAQFMPFRALTGYEDAVHETARLTKEKPELTEDEKLLLDTKLQKLAEALPAHPEVNRDLVPPGQEESRGRIRYHHRPVEES